MRSYISEPEEAGSYLDAKEQRGGYNAKGGLKFFSFLEGERAFYC